MHFSAVAPPRGERGLKYNRSALRCQGLRVAPPRGERGLKCRLLAADIKGDYRRSPSWGAWIEIFAKLADIALHVSLPLVGSVD